MTETIEAISFSNNRTTQIDSVKKTSFKAGGWDQKSLLEGKIGTHPINLVERSYSQRYVENWGAFNAVGLPVVPTLRYGVNKDGEPETLFMTDIKADGSEIYGRNFLHVLESKRANNSRFRPRHKLDGFFLDLTKPDGLKDIEKEGNGYIKIADSN